MAGAGREIDLLGPCHYGNSRIRAVRGRYEESIVVRLDRGDSPHLVANYSGNNNSSSFAFVEDRDQTLPPALLHHQFSVDTLLNGGRNNFNASTNYMIDGNDQRERARLQQLQQQQQLKKKLPTKKTHKGDNLLSRFSPQSTDQQLLGQQHEDHSDAHISNSRSLVFDGEEEEDGSKVDFSAVCPASPISSYSDGSEHNSLYGNISHSEDACIAERKLAAKSPPHSERPLHSRPTCAVGTAKHNLYKKSAVVAALNLNSPKEQSYFENSTSRSAKSKTAPQKASGKDSPKLLQVCCPNSGRGRVVSDIGDYSHDLFHSDEGGPLDTVYSKTPPRGWRKSSSFLADEGSFVPQKLVAESGAFSDESATTCASPPKMESQEHHCSSFLYGSSSMGGTTVLTDDADFQSCWFESPDERHEHAFQDDRASDADGGNHQDEDCSNLGDEDRPVQRRSRRSGDRTCSRQTKPGSAFWRQRAAGPSVDSRQALGGLSPRGSHSSSIGSRFAFSKFAVSMSTTAASLYLTPMQIEKAIRRCQHADKLGEGANGVVLKGRLDCGTQVAVKVMSPASNPRGKCDGFQRELQSLALFRHPNIVCLIGFSEVGSIKILVYECLELGDLSSILHLGRVPAELGAVGEIKNVLTNWKKRLEVAIDVGQALAFLHTRWPKVFHRDIKSGNVLLSRLGVAKLADFDLSGQANIERPDRLAVLRPEGTPGYVDPQLIERSEATEGTEVYSFGMLLLELLTGQPPATYEGNEREVISLLLEQRERATSRSPMKLRTRSSATPRQVSLQYFVDRIDRHSPESVLPFLDLRCEWPRQIALQWAALSLRCIRATSQKRPRTIEVLQRLKSMYNLSESSQNLQYLDQTRLRTFSSLYSVLHKASALSSKDDGRKTYGSESVLHWSNVAQDSPSY